MALKDEIINVAAPEKRHGPITGIEEIPKMQICFDLSNNTVSCDQRWNLVWRKRWRSWWWEQRTGSLWATLITCERFSNIFKYDQVFKHTNIQTLSKKAAVSGQHSSPMRDCQIFSNMIKYSNIQIFKHYQRSGSLWVTLITCEGLSNIFWGACEDKSN